MGFTTTWCVTALLFLVSALASHGAHADEDGARLAELESIIASMQAQMRQMQHRIDQLEGAGGSQPGAGSSQSRADVAPVVVSEPPPTRGERFKVRGDFRYRRDHIDDDAAGSRSRDRIRSRVEIVGQVTEDIDVGIGWASGGSDPVSTNQTLGSFASTKDSRLDLAYVQWQLTDALRARAGKYRNPLFRPGGSFLLWDGDLRPEGASLSYSNRGLFGTLGVNYVESDDNRGDSEYYTVQGGARFDLANDVRLTVGGGYYAFDTQGKAVPGDSEFFGNTVVDGALAFDYRVIELFSQLDAQVFGRKLRVWADVVENQDPSTEDFGWAAGARFGSVDGRGDWRVGYRYEDLEADAVFGAFSDSDFGGGGTDAKGHVFSAEFGINSRTSFGITYFLNEVGGATQGGEVDFDRLFLDLKFSL